MFVYVFFPCKVLKVSPQSVSQDLTLQSASLNGPISLQNPMQSYALHTFQASIVPLISFLLQLVQQLIDLGAIPVFKTNVPQTMFSFESSNPLWGRTTNPYNSGYTSGGSSGGEAAAVALDGSAFGIGSDIGGSLRIPPGYCGVYSLKPSAGRISRSGAASPDKGFEGIIDVVGPIGR